MKWLFKTIHLFVITSLVIGFNTSCDTSSSKEVTPSTDCRIQQYIAVSKSSFYERTNQTTYTYDDQGNLIKTTVSNNQRPTTGTVGTQTFTKTTTYTYNADGYLTASKIDELNQITSPTPIEEKVTTTQSFSYTNSRLSGYTTTRVGAYGITTITIGSLAYDETGGLHSKIESSSYVIHDPSKVKEMPGGSTGGTRTWIYQNNQLVDYVERSGTTEQHPYTIVNGVITKIIGSNYEIRLEYDSRQHVIKQEFYVDGTLNDYFTQTWSTAKSASVALPALKGFPNVIAVNDFQQAGVLTSQKTYFRNSVTNAIEQYQESTYTVQANSQGFISGATITVKHPNAAASNQDFTTTETYTYTACQ